MQPNETQPNNPQDQIPLSNDELAAAMGFMTSIGDQQMQPVEGQENAPQQEQEPKEDESIDDELKAIKDEISSIKDEIAEVLEDKEEENGQEE